MRGEAPGTDSKDSDPTAQPHAPQKLLAKPDHVLSIVVKMALHNLLGRAAYHLRDRRPIAEVV